MVYPIEIQQLSRYCFQIRWSDSSCDEYLLSDLQKNCPCLSCQSAPKIVEPLVMAEEIKTIGKYGLKIIFTSGCNQGIFSFSDLKNLPAKEKK